MEQDEDKKEEALGNINSQQGIDQSIRISMVTKIGKLIVIGIELFVRRGSSLTRCIAGVSSEKTTRRICHTQRI